MSDALHYYPDLEMTLLKCTVSAGSVDSSAAGDRPALFNANSRVSLSASEGSIKQTNWTQ